MMSVQQEEPLVLGGNVSLIQKCWPREKEQSRTDKGEPKLLRNVMGQLLICGFGMAGGY